MKAESVGLFIELATTAITGAPTDLTDGELARYRDFRPVAERVERLTESHPKGPVPSELLLAIAHVESSWGKFNRGPDIEGTDAVALGPMQILSTHLGRTFGDIFADAPTFQLTEANVNDPFNSMLAAAQMLITDFGYGDDGPRKVLGRYGGFATKNPQPYVERVLESYAKTLALRVGRLGKQA